MTDNDQTVGLTADALVVIRSGEQARKIGLEDSFAGWFVTEEGHRLVQMALQVDPVFEQFNLSRYLYTTSLLTGYGADFDQIVLLGAGFDSRPHLLGSFKSRLVKVFEVDTAQKLAQKQAQLQHYGVTLPAWDHYIPCDIREDNLPDLLHQAGLQSERPVLVLAEGLFFYLPPEVSLKILHPDWLHLAQGSRIIFDCWSADRINCLNERIEQKIGSPLFQPFPFAVTPEQLQAELTHLGYRDVRITSLASLAQRYYHQQVDEEFFGGWQVVEAVV